MTAAKRPLKFRRRRSIFPVEPIDLGMSHDVCRDRQEDSAMSLDVAPIGPIDAAGAPDPLGRRVPAPAPGTDDASAISFGTVPEQPPAEVLDAIGAAAARHDELAAQGRQLVFALDAEAGGVTVELHDLDGNVLRTLAPSEALDVATGAPVE
jgi:flagellar protein FlaG